MFNDSEDISVELFRSVLSKTHYEGEFPTIYSNICDLRNNKLYLYYFHNYLDVIEFDLEQEFKKGNKQYFIRDLFLHSNAEQEFRRTYDCTDRFGIGPVINVTFEIIPEVLPSDTSRIYITGNNDKLGNWDPKFCELNR